ncbi:adhesion G-protein coupled receptor G2-like [Anneissia japonica]|uniref:adhesion G-protein coupled receptor G2-like n=1 Tax=Anneissia japonica TaxID=1529436 RepID=UPI0014258143|nr:adhesion G-protein coupled receptor G2-like [Anneissia japonica]
MIFLKTPGITLSPDNTIQLQIISVHKAMKLRKNDPMKLLCQLCLSLLGLYVVFLVNVGTEGDKNSRACFAVGAILHYFLLSSIFWMSAQAFNMYYLFVKIFDPHVSHLLLKACLFAWGFPAVIVLVSALIDVHSYIDETNCFLTHQRMYYGVAIPVALSLIFNMVIFIMVFHSLSKIRTNTNEVHIKKRKNKGMQMLQNGVSITTVLGLTWLVGFFAIGDASEIMLLLFCILNSFQGFIIFIMYCVRNKEVRTHWWTILRDLPVNAKRLRSFMTGEQHTGISSSLHKNQALFRPNSDSYTNQFRNNISNSSQVMLGKRSFTSEDITIRY